MHDIHEALLECASGKSNILYTDDQRVIVGHHKYIAYSDLVPVNCGRVYENDQDHRRLGVTPFLDLKQHHILANWAGGKLPFLGRHGRQEITVTSIENRKNTAHMLAYQSHQEKHVGEYTSLAVYPQPVPNHTYPTRKSLPAAVPRAMFEPW